MRAHRFGVFLIAFVTAIVLTGCGGEGQPVRVTGVVRYKGKPVPNLIVHFVPEQGRESTGTTDAAGAFTLKYARDVEGAVRGKHKVFIEIKPRDPKQEAEIAAGKALPPEQKAIRDKYGKASSTLSIEVTKSGQEVPLDLD